MDRQIRFHVELETERNIETGLEANQAARAAQRSFGGIEQGKEGCGEAWGTRLVEESWRDLVVGARVLRRHPAFTAVAVVTVGLGIGANTAVFSIVNAALLSPLRLKESDQLVMLRAFAGLQRSVLVSIAIADLDLSCAFAR